MWLREHMGQYRNSSNGSREGITHNLVHHLVHQPEVLAVRVLILEYAHLVHMPNARPGQRREDALLVRVAWYVLTEVAIRRSLEEYVTHA